MNMVSERFFRFFRHLNRATLKQALQRAGEQRLPGLAAEIAYNSMLSLFPSILALLTAIGIFAGLRSTVKEIANQLSQVTPQEALFLIEGFVKTVSRGHNEGLFSLSFIVALWTASAAMNAAMAALDQIHQIPVNKRRSFIRAKLVAIGLTIGTILLLIVAAFLMFISDLIVKDVASRSDLLRPGLLSVWRLLTWPVALAIVASAFAFVYRYGPSRWTKGTPILPGALLAAISWAIISGLFRLYVTNFGNYNAAYGTVGTVIVLMLWMNLSSLVMLFGDQLNVTVGEAMRGK